MKYKTEDGRIGRSVFVRILPGEDLMESIKQICSEKNIKFAYIGTCLGSLKKVRFVYALTDEDRYFKLKYSEPVVMEGPIEFLSAHGMIAKDDGGEYQCHMHAMFSDEAMKVYGGHLLDEGNVVLATMDMVINEVLDVDIKRNYHKPSGFYFFEPAREE